jgi:hypothetical protein
MAVSACLGGAAVGQLEGGQEKLPPPGQFRTQRAVRQAAQGFLRRPPFVPGKPRLGQQQRAAHDKLIGGITQRRLGKGPGGLRQQFSRARPVAEPGAGQRRVIAGLQDARRIGVGRRQPAIGLGGGGVVSGRKMRLAQPELVFRGQRAGLAQPGVEQVQRALQLVLLQPRPRLSQDCRGPVIGLGIFVHEGGELFLGALPQAELKGLLRIGQRALLRRGRFAPDPPRRQQRENHRKPSAR